MVSLPLNLRGGTFGRASAWMYNTQMLIECAKFEESVRCQIELNRKRTPEQRFLALCALLDSARAMAPTDQASRHRRLRVSAHRQIQREQWRAEYRRLV